MKESEIAFLDPEFPYLEPRLRAVVLFSGGLDSLSSLLWAKKRYADVAAFSINYGQRHAVELEAAKKIAVEIGVHHEIVNIPAFGHLARGGLVEAGAPLWEDPKAKNPVMTGSIFVPARNAVFLSLAAGYAVSHGARSIVVGEGQADAELFPDARRSFFKAMERALSAGIDAPLRIRLPLFGYTKAEGMKIGMKCVGKARFLALAAMAVSCYRGTHCGDCPACSLRAKGFEDLQIRDPARRHR